MLLVMVFGTLLCRVFKAILRIGFNLPSLGPVDSILGPLLFIIYINNLYCL